MIQQRDVIVVGGGMAGAAVIAALRQIHFRGSIRLVCAEPELPYDRPALSKDYFTGERPAERLLLRSGTFWQEQNVEIQTGCEAVRVDARRQCVELADGSILGYGALVWAAGSKPRDLPWARSLPFQVLPFRSRADVDRINSRLPDAKRVAIVGAGFIGLETAPGLLKKGKSVILLEAGTRLLESRTAPVVSNWIERMHRAKGVEFKLGVQVTEPIMAEGRLSGIRLMDGSAVDCDLVIVAIGTQPVCDPLGAAGAETSNGIDVDEHCRSSLPNVYAIGDCAAQISPYAGGKRVRIESVQHATDQAKAVALTLAGTPTTYDAVPWFWSHQFDMKLQTVGLSSGYDTAVTRGDPQTGKFSVAYLRDGRILAFDCINNTKDFMQSKALVKVAAMLPIAAIADASVPLASLVASG